MALRTCGQLAAENAGSEVWCGPTAVALLTGQPYPRAVEAIRAADPADRLNRAKVMRASNWHHLLAALTAGGVEHEARRVSPRLVRGRWAWPTLASYARTLEPGWFLLRVTGHFLLLHVAPDRTATIHDNHGDPRRLDSKRARAARRVTHCARIPHGPKEA
ncbi:hypothetical protein RQ831_15790 [Roseomonas gilardii]|uniref:Peptidase C39-like domain-containing protein n=1 Tax=Roseomonas gilardii TaxID=257708 RepID=A0ABU3MJ12_9PROT|nr:hypothetical protein [Roseomonas gilardii]MDT8332523.1 hypothetical protein [Roseomonas gilardii]